MFGQRSGGGTLDRTRGKVHPQSSIIVLVLVLKGLALQHFF
jgi:hypothetical protein